MTRHRIVTALRIGISVALLVLSVIVMGAGLNHPAVLHEALLMIAAIIVIIVALNGRRISTSILAAGCICFLLPLPLLAPYAFIPFPPANAPRSLPLRNGRTRILFDPFSIVTSWEIARETATRGNYAPECTLDLVSPNMKSEIRLSVYSVRGMNTKERERECVKSQADFLRTGNEPQVPTTFHSMAGLTMSRISRGSERLKIPAGEQITEDITVVAWNDHYMAIVTGYPMGDEAAKREIDRTLGTLQVR